MRGAGSVSPHRALRVAMRTEGSTCGGSVAGPNPDLVLRFGDNDMLFGMMPWQLAVTEIMCVIGCCSLGPGMPLPPRARAYTPLHGVPNTSVVEPATTLRPYIFLWLALVML